MTEDEVYSFRDDLVATIPGFVDPVAYGIGVIEEGGTRIPVANWDGLHRLPSVVLASVLGYRSGTCTLAVTAEQLVSAIGGLAPAESCTAFDHPNLWAWRDLLDEAPDGPFVAVFLGDANDHVADEPQAALRQSKSDRAK